MSAGKVIAIIGGAGLAGGLLYWVTRPGDAHAATLPGLGTDVAAPPPPGKPAGKPGRSERILWHGPTAAPADFTPRPRFAVGDPVTIHNQAEPGVDPDQLTEGQTAKVLGLVYREFIMTDAAGVVTPLAGAPRRWSYVLDLKVGGLPLDIAEESLTFAPAVTAVAQPAPVAPANRVTEAALTAPAMTFAPDVVPHSPEFLAKEAAAKVAPPAAPVRPVPLYPVGTTAQLGEYHAEVKQAWYDLGHWNYLLEVGPVPLLGTLKVSLTEDEVKQKAAGYAGQPAGPAYPKGGVFMRNGKGGEVTGITGGAGGYAYQLKGWGNPLTEAQLAATLNGVA